ncbi:MAG TPA: sulfur carrier protein ThiS [Fimbriiglobus sp.]|jgi:thiazole synthase
MPSITLNAEPRTFADPMTVAGLLQSLGKDPAKLAVEVNFHVVPRAEHPKCELKDGDAVEIVTLVGGGSGWPEDKPLNVGKFSFRSRLFTGTGKFATYDLMQQCMVASGCDVTTVAVRRERLIDAAGKSLLDFLDLKTLTILPNTAGCFSAEDAIRHARLARELLTNLGNPGAGWVKLECLGDKKTLLPDPVDTLKATEQLVKDGFTVLVYTSDDPMQAKRLKAAGAASVMPAGSPIGSGQGVLNPNAIRIILEYLKDGDPDYPVIVDAGVGTASDVAAAMELGCDGVLLNTAIAGAKDPLRMATAMRQATEAGRNAYLAGRIPKKLYATASSPADGLIGARTT